MRFFGILLMLAGIGTAIVALCLTVTVATEVPDPTYTYAVITKTIDVVNLDKVRVQLIWLAIGLAATVLGGALAAIGDLAIRLKVATPFMQVQEAPGGEVGVSQLQGSQTPEDIDDIELRLALNPVPAPLTPEETAERAERERRELTIFAIGSILVIAAIILAVVIFAPASRDQIAAPAANQAALENQAMEEVDNASSAAFNAAASATPTPPKTQAETGTPINEDTGDEDFPDAPVAEPTSVPAPTPSAGDQGPRIETNSAGE